MTVNHAGALTVEYFVSYLKLIINSRSFSLEQAIGYAEKEFFNQNKKLYGEQTYITFIVAYEKLREENERK